MYSQHMFTDSGTNWSSRLCTRGIQSRWLDRYGKIAFKKDSKIWIKQI